MASISVRINNDQFFAMVAQQREAGKSMTEVRCVKTKPSLDKTLQIPDFFFETKGCFTGFTKASFWIV